MPQDVWIKFYGRGVEKTPQCYNKIKKPSAYRVKDQTISIQLKIYFRDHVLVILTTYMEARLKASQDGQA